MVSFADGDPQRASETMNLIVNGEEQSVPDGLTVVQLLERLDLPGTRVAVERNRTIVPRAEFSQVHLPSW